MGRPRFDGGTPEQQEQRAKKRRYNAAYKKLNFTSAPRWVHGDARAEAKPAAAVLFARDLLLAQPQSLTARICGDPLPGRSALDRKTKQEGNTGMIPMVADCNHANDIKIEALSHSTVIAVIHKASQGTKFTDPTYKLRRQLCKTYGLEFGAYHFNGADAVKDQVEHFFQCAQPDAETVMVLDYEDAHPQMPFRDMIEFLELADEKLGRPVDIYSGNRIKDSITVASDYERAVLAKRRLWLCQYGPVARLNDVNGHALPWKSYWLWQYTGDGIGPLPHTAMGLEPGSDLSTYAGSAEELRANWVAKPALVA